MSTLFKGYLAAYLEDTAPERKSEIENDVLPKYSLHLQKQSENFLVCQTFVVILQSSKKEKKPSTYHLAFFYVESIFFKVILKYFKEQNFLCKVLMLDTSK